MRLKWIFVSIAVLLVGIAFWFNWNPDSEFEKEDTEEVSEEKPKSKREDDIRNFPDIGSPEKQPESSRDPQANLKPLDPKLEESMKELEKGVQAMMEQGINMLYGPLYDELGLNDAERREMTKQIQNQANKNIELAMKITDRNVSARDILRMQEAQEAQRHQNLQNILKNGRAVDRVEAFEKTLPQRQADMQADIMLSRYKGQLNGRQMQDAKSIVSDYFKNVMDPAGTGSKISSETIENIRNGNFQKDWMDNGQKRREQAKQELIRRGISVEDAEQILGGGMGKF
jgi:hypothetical protein